MAQSDVLLALRHAAEWRASRLPSRADMEQIASALPPPRVIKALDGTTPYLSRYYLHGRPTMPDGSEPFDEFGDVRDGVLWPRSGQIVLHYFHRGDRERELHCHPWDYAASLILIGGYREERRVGDSVEEREYRPGDVNLLGRADFHRTDLIEQDCWTLFMTGPKVHQWGYWNRETGGFTEWRKFHEYVRAAAGGTS